MTIAIGRSQLVVNLVASLQGSLADRFRPRGQESDPGQELDLKLAQLEARRTVFLERCHWVSSAALHGVGRPL
jgi:hypothetical protein